MKSTQALWDRYYQATLYGGPWGLGTWIAAAKARSKKLAVPEWGVWAQSRNPAPDDPVYISNMYATFKTNAAWIDYESYFDVGAEHQLYPTTRFPNAAAAYRSLWSAGR